MARALLDDLERSKLAAKVLRKGTNVPLWAVHRFRAKHGRRVGAIG